MPTYAELIEKRFRDMGRDPEEAFKDGLAVFKACTANGKLSLTSRVHVYEYCPSDGALFQDFAIE